MSRVGKSPINIPNGVIVDIEESIVKIKGPKGELSQYINPDMTLKVEKGVLMVKRPTEQKRHKALHGLYRSLINNMVIGVTEGYKKEIELIGVGYKADVKKNVLELNIGYSHNIFFIAPESIKISTEMVGKIPKITIEGIDKQLVGAIVAKIKSLRKVEPYKGKGIRFVGEQIKRKAGKTASK